MKTALVIIDLQNDFLAEGGAYVRGGCTNPAALALPSRVLKVAQAIKKHGGLVAASQFTLWPDTAGQPMISAHLKAMRPFLRQGDFAPGSNGQACVDVLLPVVDVAVQKVAYSAFFNTQLDWLLKKNDITQVVVCGIVTNGGVASTVRDAHMRDYDTWVLSDGCAAFSDVAHETALADMQTVAHVTSCQSFIDQQLNVS
jgi:ureidoacrylate peracid hydrolase